jgi:hypothetical protein
MMTAVMNVIFLLHMEVMQRVKLPDVVKWMMLEMRRSSGMWSLWAGDGNLLSRVCFWCQVDLGYIQELYGCGSLETVEIYTHVSNEGIGG